MADKVAIVTGAARGTGAAIARAFVAEGARVWVADVLEDLGTETAHELGDSVRFLKLDVMQEASWSAASERVLARDGHVDVLVNNAAVLHLGSLVDTMKAQQGGSIVNIASVDGVNPKNWVAARPTPRRSSGCAVSPRSRR